MWHVLCSLASCQIRKISGAHAPGMPGTFSPLQRVSDADMHHGTCFTHVLWCMAGSLSFSFEVGGGENVPGIPGACATCNFTYLVSGPCQDHVIVESKCAMFSNTSPLNYMTTEDSNVTGYKDTRVIAEKYLHVTFWIYVYSDCKWQTDMLFRYIYMWQVVKVINVWFLLSWIRLTGVILYVRHCISTVLWESITW